MTQSSYLKIKENNFLIRPWFKEDFHKNHLQLLSQLTTVGEINEEQYYQQFNLLNSDSYFICVIENRDENTIVGSATLLVENKLIHNCGKVGHIEDVVIDSKYRGYGLGKIIIEKLVEKAKEKNCYKVILDCSLENIPFYEKCGFRKIEFEMRHDL